MDFLDNVGEANGRSFGTNRKPANSRPLTRENQGLRIGLAQEAHDIALLVAATGSIVNAIVSGRRPQLRTCMAAYLPGAPTLYPAAISANTAGHAITAEAVKCLGSFYSLIAFARTATLNYSARREPGGISGPVGMDTLGEAWQSAAMQSIGVLTILGYLDPSSGLLESNGDNSATLRLVDMLWGVTVGRSPCVRIDGAVIVPGWIERRTHARREINAPATLQFNGTTQHVVVRDLSAGGLGLEGGEDLQPGDVVNVSLGTGVKFEGIAVWNRGGRVGVKLTAPLKSPISED